MSAAFTTAQRSALATMNDRQIIALLGEILEPSANGPCIIQSDDLFDVLDAATSAYQDAFRALQATLDYDTPEAASERAADRADYLYDMRRDDEMERAA